MDVHTHDPARRRALLENELAARRGQRGTLQTELDHCIQTHEDPQPIRARLADLDAEIHRLEAEIAQG